MAFEVLMSECVFGFETMRADDANPTRTSIFRSSRTSARRCSSTRPLAAYPRPYFRASSTEPHAWLARAHGDTCSGRDVTARRLWRAWRMCARPCAHTPCLTEGLI